MTDSVDGMFNELRSAAARIADPPATGEPEPHERPSEALPGVRATPAAARQLPAEAVAAAQRLLTAVSSDGQHDAERRPPTPRGPDASVRQRQPNATTQGPLTRQHRPSSPDAQRCDPLPPHAAPANTDGSTAPSAMADHSEDDATIAAPTSRSELELIVAGTVRPLPRGPVVVGRDPGPDGLTIDDPEVSRRHLELRPTALGLQATDLGSLNGTRLRRGGQQQVVTTTGTVLRPGDQLVTASGKVLVSLRRHDR